jgi:hypothetical protein
MERGLRWVVDPVTLKVIADLDLKIGNSTLDTSFEQRLDIVVLSKRHVRPDVPAEPLTLLGRDMPECMRITLE